MGEHSGKLLESAPLESPPLKLTASITRVREGPCQPCDFLRFRILKFPESLEPGERFQRGSSSYIALTLKAIAKSGRWPC